MNAISQKPIYMGIKEFMQLCAKDPHPAIVLQYPTPKNAQMGRFKISGKEYLVDCTWKD